MSAQEWVAAILLSLGALTTLIASVGLGRFHEVLPRLHVTSKPQMLGLTLVLAGAAVAVGTWQAAGMLLLVLLAQMVTVPVSSTIVARAVFRRGFVTAGDYAIDELTPRLARPSDDDEDDDGFVDDYRSDDDLVGEAAGEGSLVPSNVVPEHELSEHPEYSMPNWDEPEAGESEDTSTGLIDVDLEDETEKEAGSIALEDERHRLARAEAHAAKQAARHHH